MFLYISFNIRITDLERQVQGTQNELEKLPDPADLQVKLYSL
jgi:hypothetical protein